MSEMRVFAAGELVQLTDPKGKPHTITLVPGKVFHTHRGGLAHDDIIGQPDGSVIPSVGGMGFLALRPLLDDFILAMPRGAAVIYPKDAARIVGLTGIGPGSRVAEAGVGSGALTSYLIRAVNAVGSDIAEDGAATTGSADSATTDGARAGSATDSASVTPTLTDSASVTPTLTDSASVTPTLTDSASTEPAPVDPARGEVHSLELREEFANVARKNVVRWFGHEPAGWTLTVGDMATDLTATGLDAVVLDMVDPWACIDVAARAVRPGGVLVAYVATTTQLSRFVESLRVAGGWTEPRAEESLVRTWHLEGLAVRPDHRMIGHTAFLVAARRLAPGAVLPPKRRRPAPGAYGPDYTGPGAMAAADAQTAEEAATDAAG